jgi:acylphosphatase
MSSTQRVFVSGRVQGVSFRDWAVREARRHGVTGWVRNLNDGRVELLVSGAEDAVTAMVESIRNGPPGARVDNVTAQPDQADNARGFTRRFTV